MITIVPAFQFNQSLVDALDNIRQRDVDAKLWQITLAGVFADTE
jgi:hypothetical protein